MKKLRGVVVMIAILMWKVQSVFACMGNILLILLLVNSYHQLAGAQESGFNATLIRGQTVSNIYAVKLAHDGSVIVLSSSGGGTYKTENFQQGFLASWGISDSSAMASAASISTPYTDRKGELNDGSSDAGDLENVKALLKNNTDWLFGKDEDGWTPLHRAAWKGKKTVAELLLVKGANVNSKDKDGLTPLCYAAMGGHKDVADLLLNKGADVNAKGKDGDTPLLYAAYAGYKDVVEMLLAKGAEVNLTDKQAASPLHQAAKKGNRDVAQLLLDKGADLNAKDKDDNTPLHYAALVRQKEVVALLLAKGADVNAKNKEGDTPLDFTGIGRYRDVVVLHHRETRTVANPSDTIRVWNQMIGIMRVWKSNLLNTYGDAALETGMQAANRLKTLKYGSQGVDSNLLALIDREINAILDLRRFGNEAATIVNADPNNERPATLSRRFDALNSLEDLVARGNDLPNDEEILRLELQAKYHISLLTP